MSIIGIMIDTAIKSLLPFLLCLVFEPSESQIISNNRLIMVFVLSRHGDRSPMHTFKNDPFSDHWVEGSGQLTSTGAEQHYDLGAFIRSRYESIVPKVYHLDEVKFVSSATERTLMSAYNFIHGLYPYDKWSSANRYPPVFSRPIEEDYLLKMSVKCPAYSKKYHEILYSKSVHKSIAKYEDLFKLLKRVSGENFGDKPTSIENLIKSWKLCDAITIWVDHNLPNYPKWVTEKSYQQCCDILDFKQTIRFSTPSLTYFRGGPLAAHVIEMFRERIKMESAKTQTEHQPKRFRSLAAYFAHDSTLAAIMSYFGIFNGIRPPLASSLFMELYQSHPEVNTAFVRFIYRNETRPGSRKIWYLWPPICGSQDVGIQNDYLCPLSILENALPGTYATNVSVECYPDLQGSGTVRESTCYYPQILSVILIQVAFVFFIISRFTALSFARIINFFKLKANRKK